MHKTYNLYFNGYTWHEFVFYVKNAKGIVLVYKGNKNISEEYDMTELLYVDYTDDLRSFSESNKVKEMFDSLQGTEKLFYSYAEVERDDVLINYLIYKFKPKYNQLATNPLCDINVIIDGKCDFLN